MTTEETTQPRLVPDEPLDIANGYVTLEELAHEEVPKPSRELIESIRRFGLLQPLLVRETLVRDEWASNPDPNAHTMKRDIVAGRRRLAVCRLLPIDPIPAMIVETDLSIADVMTLAENSTRTNNPVAEFDAISRLVAQGASEKDISGATGMSRQTIKKRQTLLNLIPELTDAFRQGKMAASVAEGAAKLPKVLQSRLAGVVMMENRLTERHLHEVKTAMAQEAMENLSFDIAEEERPAASVPDRIEASLAQELQGIIERMPREQGVFIRSLAWVAAGLLDLAMGETPNTDNPPERVAQIRPPAAYTEPLGNGEMQRYDSEESHGLEMEMPWEIE